MVIIARVHFPRCHINQAATAYTGLPALPPEIQRSGPFFRTDGDRVNAITIYSVPEGAAPDQLSGLRERYRPFAAIPDFSCDIHEWRDFRETLADWVK